MDIEKEVAQLKKIREEARTGEGLNTLRHNMPREN